MADHIYYHDAKSGAVAGSMLDIADRIQSAADQLAAVPCAEIGPAVLAQAANEAAGMWASGAGKLAGQATQLGQQIKDEVANYASADKEALATFKRAVESGEMPESGETTIDPPKTVEAMATVEYSEGTKDR